MFEKYFQTLEILKGVSHNCFEIEDILYYGFVVDVLFLHPTLSFGGSM